MKKAIWKYVAILAVCMAFLWYLPGEEVLADNKQKFILILYQSTPTYPAVQETNEGIQNGLDKSQEYQFEYNYEYLDIANHNDDDEYFKKIAQYLKYKYRKTQPDYIIANVKLYNLLVQYGNEMFPGVPIVINWNLDWKDIHALPQNYVAVTYYSEVDKGIQLILKTRPNTKKIYMVAGDSVIERSIIKKIVKVQKNYENQVEFVLLNTLPYTKMLEKVSNAEENSVILYYQWNVDIEGNSFIPADVLKKICTETKAPVYGNAMQYMGSGIIGGYVADHELVGEALAGAVLDSLSGKKPEDNQVITINTRSYCFDWRQLKRWDIDEDKLPSGSIIQYKEFSIWELYGGYIAGGLVFIFLETLLIMMLLISRRIRRKAEEELKISNNSLQQMTDKLIKVDKVKDDFLAITSHELRTPLNGIVNITQSVLEGDEGDLSEGQRESLEIVKSSGERLYHKVNDILDILKLKQGEIKLEVRPERITDIISSVVYVFQFLSIKNDVVIIQQLSHELPLIIVDGKRVKQIFYNLIGNAIKFTELGSIIIRAEIKEGWLEVSVEDTGIGIEEAKLANIFDTYMQTENDATIEDGDTGLGLTITKKLVALHGGEIWIFSRVGIGTRVTFTLPIALGYEESERLLVQEQPQPQRQFYSQAEGSESKGDNDFRILVVDDDAVNLQAIKNVLSQERYSIMVVPNGQAVLNLLEKDCEFDLVILDIMIPGLTGFEVLKRLRDKYTQVELPIIILTTRTTKEDLEVGFHLGANDFLRKPFEANELRVRVKTLIQLKGLVNDKVNAELMFLQAQIKPHFLYNAMSSIIALCYTDAKRAGELLYSLSNYIRRCFDFNNKKTFISIQNELEFVHYYIDIEKARFGESLQVEFSVEDSLLECNILPFAIQPLVENAIRHGINNKEEGGTVKIIIHKKVNEIEVCIEDDGVGMSSGKVEGLLHKIKIISEASNDKRNTGVGLSNINNRLIKFYGKGICIDSTQDKGTKVFFQYPLEVDKGDNGYA